LKSKEFIEKDKKKEQLENTHSEEESKYFEVYMQKELQSLISNKSKAVNYKTKHNQLSMNNFYSNFQSNKNTSKSFMGNKTSLGIIA